MATQLRPFRFWCQRVLPLVYDDSLSYYEVLCKVVDYLNNVIADVNSIVTDNIELEAKFNELKSYVETYFYSLDLQEEVNKKLDAMASDGTLTALIEPFLNEFQSDIIQIQASVGAVEKQIESVNSRVDSLIIGSGDSEISDSKIDAYGSTYNLLSERLLLPEEGLRDNCLYRSYALVSGYYSDSNLITPDPNKKMYSTQIISVPENGFMITGYDDGVEVYVTFYVLNSDGTYSRDPSLTSISWTTTNIYLYNTEDHPNIKFALSFRKNNQTDWFSGILPCRIISFPQSGKVMENVHKFSEQRTVRILSNETLASGYSTTSFYIEKDMVDYVLTLPPFSATIMLRNTEYETIGIISPPNLSDYPLSGYNYIKVPDIYNGEKVQSLIICVSQFFGIQSRTNFMNTDTYRTELEKKLIVFSTQPKKIDMIPNLFNAYAIKRRGEQLQNVTFKPVTNTMPMYSTITSVFNQYKWKGVPYMGSWISPRIFYWHISPYTFLSAVKNINSRLYTFRGGSASEIYYGMACSGFGSYCLNTPIPIGNTTLRYDYEQFGLEQVENNVEELFKLQPGNLVLHYNSQKDSHCAIVHDVAYKDGTLAYITLIHENSPVIHYRTYDFTRTSYSGFYNFYQYVYKKNTTVPSNTSPDLPYPNEVDYEVPDPTNLMLCRGDKSIYDETQNIEVTIIPENATIINLYKEGVLYKQLGISSLNPVVKNGYRTVYIQNQIEEDGLYTLTTDVSEIISTFRRRTRPTLTVINNIVSWGNIGDLIPWYFQLSAGINAEPEYIDSLNIQGTLNQQDIENHSWKIPEKYGDPGFLYLVFKDDLGATFSHNAFGDDATTD